MYNANVAVCSEIRTKHKQREHHVEFLNVKPDGTSRKRLINNKKMVNKQQMMTVPFLPIIVHYKKSNLRGNSYQPVRALYAKYSRNDWSQPCISSLIKILTAKY